MKKIGKINRFFERIMVAVIDLEDNISVGDEIIIKGEITNFKQKIQSMEINREKIKSAKAGEEIAIKVNQKVNINDVVYKE